MAQELEKFKSEFETHVRNLQDEITNKLKSLDDSLEINEDNWDRLDHSGAPGGGGRTRAFSGKVFENAGVNTSTVFGKIDPKFGKSLAGGSDEIWATGISLIIHPYNPKVPTVHANFRMIQNGEKVWFGGGADLTPFYPNEEDFSHFHDVWAETLTPYGVYEDMKQKCDDYFVNHHRNGEMRGVGGFFYDHYNSGDLQKDYDMVKNFSNQFIRSYFPIVEKRYKESFTSEDEDFQLHRRGRYVEFNLLHDRGTLFGLRTNGRTDSILISLPARCKYTYSYRPRAGSPHAKMMEYYFPKDWRSNA